MSEAIDLTLTEEPEGLGIRPLSALLISALLAAALVACAYWFSVLAQSARLWVAHTEEVLAAIASTRSDLVEIQNGLRGFVISGDDGDLAPYQAALLAARTDAARLQALTADNPLQQESARGLRSGLEPRAAAAQAVIVARREDGFEAARAVLDQRLSPKTQAGAIHVLDAMEIEERRLLAERLSEQSGRTRAFWAAAAMLVLGLLTALGAMYAQIRRKRVLEHALLEREQEFHSMTDSVTEYAILMLDLQGNVRTWNPGGQRIKGYSAEEIVGRNFSCFYTEEDRRDGKPGLILRRALETGLCADEGWRVRKDGSRFWASVAVTPVRGMDGKVTGFCKITRDLSERKAAEDRLANEIRRRVRIEEELQRVNARLEMLVEERTVELSGSNAELADSKARLEHLSQQLLSAQEEERRHIARELHDETGQALTLIRMNLAELSARDAADNSITQCIQHVDRAIQHIRGLSVRLRPPMLDDLGLVDAIEWLVEQQSQAAGWRARLELADMTDRLPEQIETACFRICQEALTNAARYARAKEVRVSLHVSGRELVMEVADDGAGFDLQQYRSVDERKKHFGLVSMTERAALAGGQLEVDTAPGRGTQVRARFPLR